jgi:DNA ligase (NAD+)
MNGLKFTKAFFNKLVSKTTETLNDLSEDEIANVIQYLNHQYHNKGVTPVNDNIYDLIVAHLKELNDKHPILLHVGALVDTNDSRKEKLPVFMGSMDKIKDEASLISFKKKYGPTYTVSDKLDGVSALLYKEKEQLFKLYSRGDGTVGQNISHLVPFIQNIPKKIKGETVIVRGELIINKSNFEKVKAKGANARNMVAGLVNAKIPDMQLLQLVEFKAYALIEPSDMTIEDQFKTMKKMKFDVANYQVLKDAEVNVESLSKILMDRRNHEYEIDGIIVADNKFHKLENNKNPAYAFAFKSILTNETAEVIVTNVVWNISKDGFFKPVVEIEPVKLNGVVIKKATGFNGDFIKTNKIGPGAKVLITRSGDVIPYILNTLIPAEKPQFPDEPYTWNETKKEIMVQGPSEEQDMKLLENFFNTIDIKGVSGKSIDKIYNAGFKTVEQVVKAKSTDFESIQGLLNKAIIYEKIHKRLNEVECATLMHASNTLGRGFGEKRIKLILDKFPGISTGETEVTVEQLVQIDGISTITATQFVVGMKRYREFLQATELQCISLNQNSLDKKEEQKFKDQVVVFTGFRDKVLEDKLIAYGARIGSSVSGKTTYLITKDKDVGSKKVVDAKEKGIMILSKDELTEVLG